ncbi:hypothetical protein R6Q57_001345 [Mikania cordata]
MDKESNTAEQERQRSVSPATSPHTNRPHRSQDLPQRRRTPTPSSVYTHHRGIPMQRRRRLTAVRLVCDKAIALGPEVPRNRKEVWSLDLFDSIRIIVVISAGRSFGTPNCGNMGANPELQSLFPEKKRVRNPYVPIGALITAGVLTAGLISFKQGNSQLGQTLMRARVVAQGGTVALMVVTAAYYGEKF